MPMYRKNNTRVPFAVPTSEEHDLRSWLLLLLLPQSRKSNTGDLDDLETHTGNISLRLALTSETSKQDLVVLIDEVQATIVWH